MSTSTTSTSGSDSDPSQPESLPSLPLSQAPTRSRSHSSTGTAMSVTSDPNFHHHGQLLLVTLQPPFLSPMSTTSDFHGHSSSLSESPLSITSGLPQLSRVTPSPIPNPSPSPPACDRDSEYPTQASDPSHPISVPTVNDFRPHPNYTTSRNSSVTQATSGYGS